MRLIDADALIEALNNSGVQFDAEVNRIILEQPTAYDVEKVLEELESLNPVDYGSMFSYEGHRCARELKSDAIYIVERGGIDETNRC